MKKKYFFFAIILLVNFSCSREQEIDIEENSNNNPPANFVVKVDSITHESAFLSWEKAVDLENDEVKYDVSLLGTTFLTNSNELKFKINNLTELSNYTGEVIAKDIYGNSTKQNFSFSTTKYYLKYLKKHNFPETNYGGMANQIIKLRDNNYLILGHTKYLGVGKKLSVIKVDKLGNEIWNKMLQVDYEGDLGGFTTKMIQCNNSDNVIIAGGSNVAKIDFNGNLIWTKNLNSYVVASIGVSGILSLVEDSINNIYIVGDNKSTNPQKFSTGILTKLDRNGNMVFEKKFENSLKTTFNDIIIEDNKLIIFGTKEISGITWEQYLANVPLKVRYNIVTTDMNGSLVNEQSYNDTGYAFSKGIFKKSNGNYIFFGHSTGSGDYLSDVYEINQLGTVIWKKNYNYGQITSMRETKEGNLIAIGMGSGSFYTRTFYYLNDNNGNTLWMKNIYEIGTGYYGRDVLPDDDGGYRFLVTRDKSFRSFPDDYGVAYLYKTDYNGNYQ